MKKLYDEDSYISEFFATVEACVKCDDIYKVVLDQTAFFPTAGGQECDGGTLGGEKVLDVEIKDEIIYHSVKNPLEVGTTVSGKINWEERFRKMQHHSAEHIVSGLMHSRFGFENTGFHLGDEDATMDYSGEITKEQLKEIELLANETVWKNLKISAVYPNDDELSRINYRSKLDLSENVRIVTIEGIDCCACCAPHVKTTGEIGVIKISDMMRHRGGIRVRMICARDAVLDYQQKCDSVAAVSKLLSAPKNEIEAAVLKLMEENDARKRKYDELMLSVIAQKVNAIPKTDGNICIFEENADMNTLRRIADMGKEKCNVFAALSGNDEEGYSYVICSKNVNLAAISKDINTALSGRGGGRDMISGKFSAKRQDIIEYFEKTDF